MSKYEAVIGLEVHVQVKTNSKMFCSCPNSYGENPNTMVCPVCMGYPGVMPVPNKEAIRRTIIAGLMCSCEIPNYSKFDRKSYFYPDMPKNYQISQYDLPFCLKGKVHIVGKGFSGEELPDKNIGITRIHLEEDVAKSTHFPGASGIDFNRAGVPLMEIVSEPDMKNADEAYAYLTSLKQIMQYAGISDCDMEKGQMRCDVNISIMPRGAKEFGTKVELKNLNSFRAVHRSIEYEISRQEEAVENGVNIHQETRGWNDDQGETYLMRSKENAHDYRYFPEPDLMPIEFTDEDIENFRKEIPEHPEAKRERFATEFGLTAYDAHVLTLEKSYADYFESEVEKTNPKLFANWIISDVLREVSEKNKTIDEVCPAPSLSGMINLIDDNIISGKIAKTVFSEMCTIYENKAITFSYDEERVLPKKIVEEKGLVQVTDESEIELFVKQAISANQTQVEQYKAGNQKVLQFFVGQVMKLSKGKANPQTVVKLLQKNLGNI